MKVIQLLEAQKQKLYNGFADFVFAKSEIRNDFSDLADVEDLFDFAYLDDASATRVAEHFQEKKKTPTLSQAANEAFGRAKWCVVNMKKEDSKWKPTLLKFAKAWAESVAPEIVRLTKDYLKESLSEGAKPKVEKKYIVTCKKSPRFGGADREYKSKPGTLAELIEYYGYSLEVGQSWEHEKGNKKINRNPKTIQQLCDNLEKAANNAARDGYSGESYSWVEAPAEDVKEEKDSSYKPHLFAGYCNKCGHQTTASTDHKGEPIACKWGKCNGEVKLTRNKDVKEDALSEGMWVIKNKDGVEKRFKDKDSQAAKDWKESNSKKKPSDFPEYSTEWWKARAAKNYGMIVPWDPIRMGRSRGDLDWDKVKKAVKETFGSTTFDFTDTTAKPGKIEKDGVQCATLTVKVMVQHRVGREGVEEMHTFKFVRDPKNPTRFTYGQTA